MEHVPVAAAVVRLLRGPCQQKAAGRQTPASRSITQSREFPTSSVSCTNVSTYCRTADAYWHLSIMTRYRIVTQTFCRMP